jgi:hypothetical protein
LGGAIGLEDWRAALDLGLNERAHGRLAPLLDRAASHKPRCDRSAVIASLATTGFHINVGRTRLHAAKAGQARSAGAMTRGVAGHVTPIAGSS